MPSSSSLLKHDAYITHNATILMSVFGDLSRFHYYSLLYCPLYKNSEFSSEMIRLHLIRAMIVGPIAEFSGKSDICRGFISTGTIRA